MNKFVAYIKSVVANFTLLELQVTSFSVLKKYDAFTFAMKDAIDD